MTGQQNAAAQLRRTAQPFDVGTVPDVGGGGANEEACTAPPVQQAGAPDHGMLAIVAGGMGGGAVSQFAVSAAQERYFDAKSPSVIQNLAQATAVANSAIFSFIASQPQLRGTGATIVAAVVHNNIAYLSHVGDSRAYLVRRDAPAAEQLTADHTWVREQVATGRITAAQAETHESSHLLTHALGLKPDVPGLDAANATFNAKYALQPGDGIVLVSDGVSGVVSSQEIAEIVRRNPGEKAARQIVARPKQHWTGDNATAAVVRNGRFTGAGFILPPW